MGSKLVASLVLCSASFMTTTSSSPSPCSCTSSDFGPIPLPSHELHGLLSFSFFVAVFQFFFPLSSPSLFFFHAHLKREREHLSILSSSPIDLIHLTRLTLSSSTFIHPLTQNRTTSCADLSFPSKGYLIRLFVFMFVLFLVVVRSSFFTILFSFFLPLYVDSS